MLGPARRKTLVDIKEYVEANHPVPRV
jgi:hypothetical protein